MSTRAAKKLKIAPKASPTGDHEKQRLDDSHQMYVGHLVSTLRDAALGYGEAARAKKRAVFFEGLAGRIASERDALYREHGADAVRRLDNVVMQLGLAAQLPVAELAPRVDAMQKSRQKQTAGLTELAERKAEAKQKARNYSAKLWRNDKAQQLRIGAAAEAAGRHLADLGYDGDVIPKQETLKDWIADIAPDYARQKGRPKRK